MASARKTFWARHPGLVWSNSEAEDAVYIRAALLRPRFRQLLEIVLEFGLERVKAEWMVLLEDPEQEADRARPVVTRVLRNIEEGFARAAREN